MTETSSDKDRQRAMVWKIIQLVGWLTAFGGVALAILGEGNAGLIGLVLIIAGIADVFIGKFLALKMQGRN
ncbi:MAG: hypothetical protein AAF495_17975 [Pseudomonadota bacterium]